MPSKKTKKKLKQASQSSGVIAKNKQEVLDKQNVLQASQESNEVLSGQGAEKDVLAQDGAESLEKTNEKAVAKGSDLSEKDKQDVKKTIEKDEKSKVKKEKKPSKFKKKTKEIFSELKKVIWPTHSQVIKKTATVIAVVLIFSVVLLGIDTVLELAYNWFFSLFN